MKVKISIQTKFTITIGVVTVIILTIFGLYQYTTLKKEANGELQDLIETAIRRIPENLTLPLYNMDKTQVEKVIVSEMMEKRIFCIILRQEEDHLIVNGKARDEEWRLVDVQKEIPSDNLIEVKKEIIQDGARIGEVAVFFTPQFMEAKLKKQIVSNLVTIIVMVVVLIMALIVMMKFFLMSPLKKIHETLHKTMDSFAQGQGDLSNRIHVDAKDEIGELSILFNQFLDTLEQVISAIATHSHNLEGAADTLIVISKTMNDNLIDVSNKSKLVTTSIEKLGESSGTNAQTMNTANANIAKMEGAVGSITTAINEISEHLGKEAIISEQSVKDTNNVMAKVDRLSAVAAEIGNVTEIITEISDQINLLSLNATIEAARAGESGKGFAVVANEIKDLAKQTADASKKIKEQIKNIQDSSAETLIEIKGVSDIIHEINTLVGSTTRSISDQFQMVNHISDTIKEVTVNISEVNQNVTDDFRVTEKIVQEMAHLHHSSMSVSKDSSEVKQHAEKLVDLSHIMSQMVLKFIHTGERPVGHGAPQP